MKRKNKLLLMLAVLTLLVGATFAVMKFTESTLTVDPDVDDAVIFSVAPETVTSITWTYGGETYTAVREEDGWYSGADSTVELDSSMLDAMTAELAEVIAYRTIDDPGPLEDYGLREPGVTICVNYLDDLTLFLGNETGIGGQYYCSTDDGKVYLVDSCVMEVFSYTLERLVLIEE